MPHGHRLLIIAIGGIAIVAVVMWFAYINQPQYLGEIEAPSAETQSKPDHNGASGDRSVTCYQDCQVHFGAREEPKSIAGDDGAGQAQTESNRSQYTREGLDLLAQRRMAYWAIWLAGFTLTGLMALFWTLWETRQVTLETRRVGEKQVQAYLTCKTGRLRLREFNNRLGLSANLDIENKGHSPAKEIAIEYGATVMGLAPGSSTGTQTSYYSEERRETFCADVVPGDSQIAIVELELFPSGSHAESRFRSSPQSSLVVEGTIHWKNEFGNSQEQAFAIKSPNFIEASFDSGKGRRTKKIPMQSIGIRRYS